MRTKYSWKSIENHRGCFTTFWYLVFKNNMVFTECCSILHCDWLMTNVYLTTLASSVLLFIKVSFILPVVVLGLVYTCMVFVLVCGYIFGMKDPSPENKSWNFVTNVTFKFLHLMGRIWHGHEIEGLDNVPSKGPALMVYYHGATPFESLYLIADVYLLRKRLISLGVDKFVNFFPGWETALRLFRTRISSIKMFKKILGEGHLVIIAPGGLYEAQFSDHNYRLEWRNRLGYAKVAIKAKVPIIPFFTVNNREAFRTVNIGNSFFEKLYLKLRMPFKAVYGGYPVKLRTVFGEPIPYDPTLTAEQLDKKVRMALEQLIKDNQRIPGSIAMALLDRIYCPKKSKAA